MRSKSIFQKIIDREIFSYIVAEDDFSIAFLDIHPLTLGHTLVISKLESTGYLFDLNENSYVKLMLFSRKVSQAIKIALSCFKIGMKVEGFEINYAHIHLIPIQKPSDMFSSSTLVAIFENEMKQIALKISQAYHVLSKS